MMGTNYYLQSRRPIRTIVTHEGDERGRIVDVRREYARCHLCKLSYGWKPLLACDDEASTIPDARFRSFGDMMRFIRTHAGEYMILDEYPIRVDESGMGCGYEEIPPDEFERMIRARNGEPGQRHHDACGFTSRDGFDFLPGDWA